MWENHIYGEDIFNILCDVVRNFKHRNNMETVLVEILVGLPGSGKTYYAKEQGAQPDAIFADHSKEKVMYICTDNDAYYGRKPQTIEQLIHNHEFEYWITHHNQNWDHWIIDGLFLTNDVQHKVIDALYNEINKYTNDIKLKIRFVYFKEDREACLHNDRARNREKLANITIEHADYEKPDIEALQKDFPKFEFELVEKEVHKMNVFESKFLTKGSYYNENELRSDTWCLGGTWGDCWGNSGQVSADAQPTVFEEFDDLLTELCPNITLLQYKKLYNSLVSIETEEEHDYYGGSTKKAYYKCNLDDLYNMMIEMGLINENE